MEVFGGMLILRLVAAANMTTHETDAQMHPVVTDFQVNLSDGVTPAARLQNRT